MGWDVKLRLQRANESGDSRRTFAIVRRLAGKKTEPLRSIKSKGSDAAPGCVITDIDEIRVRWREHFSDLFKATITDRVDPPQHHVQGSGLSCGAAVAPILAWAKEVWRAVIDPHSDNPRHYGLP